MTRSPLTDAHALLALAEAATEGPWKWWTSNSWRRLRGGERDEHHVAEPCIQRPDNHPDILISQADQDFIAASRSLAPALARDVIAMAEALEKISHLDPQDISRDQFVAQGPMLLFKMARDIARAALSGKASADE